jgi:hypothetical protein
MCVQVMVVLNCLGCAIGSLVVIGELIPRTPFLPETNELVNNLSSSFGVDWECDHLWTNTLRAVLLLWLTSLPSCRVVLGTIRRIAILVHDHATLHQPLLFNRKVGDTASPPSPYK